MVCGHVHSLEATLVLEVQTNYRGRAPKDKADGAVGVIKEAFHLPDQQSRSGTSKAILT